MKEIGGYLELDEYRLPMLHDSAIALNCGRNCLAYLIRKKNIKKMFIPKFLCDSVGVVCKKEKVDVVYYSIGLDFLPKDMELTDDDWLYVVNYYGQLDNDKLTNLIKSHKRIIVDNVQAYFQEPLRGIDTIYTCRKFFGVSDGAFLYSDVKYDEDLKIDESYQRVTFLLGRYEKTASEFYSNYVSREDEFETEPIKQMSKLTKNLLHGIDYMFVKDRRTKNFRYLHEHLESINKLQLSVPNGAYMYPLYINNGAEVRRKLQGEKIYVATLWTDVFKLCNEYDLEYDMAKNILPIPVDQRYTIEDMYYICEVLKKYIS